MEKGNIHALYKNLGESPLDCINRFKNSYPEYADTPMTYAGRLDPMAEGLLLVLSGEGVYEKEKFLDLPKTYVFEVLWGVETDTLDVLGILGSETNEEYSSKGADKFLLKFSSSSLRRASLAPSQNTLRKFIGTGKFKQSYPAYSSKPVNGKPLFMWAREGKLADVEIPEHEVEVYSAKFISRREISKKDLHKEIVEKVSKVSGDFRQKEVLEYWEKVLSKAEEDVFVLDALEMTVSSGFYVRQFVYDLAKKLGLKALTFHIKRTKVGEYEVPNSA